MSLMFVPVRGLRIISNSASLWSAYAILLALLVWYFVAALGIFPRFLMPSPLDVVWRLFILVNEGYAGISLASHIEASLKRLFVAYVAVCFTGIPLGLAMGSSRWVKAIFDPIVEFYRPVPALAYLMLLVVWLGIGEAPKIMLLYLVGLPFVIINSASAVGSTRLERIQGILSLGASKWQVFRYVIFPSCLPNVFTGMRLAFGLSFAALVPAEMLAASEGLGWMLRHASQFLRTDVVLVGIFILALIALVGEGLLRLAERSLVPWTGRG